MVFSYNSQSRLGQVPFRVLYYQNSEIHQDCVWWTHGLFSLCSISFLAGEVGKLKKKPKTKKQKTTSLSDSLAARILGMNSFCQSAAVRLAEGAGEVRDPFWPFEWAYRDWRQCWSWVHSPVSILDLKWQLQDRLWSLGHRHEVCSWPHSCRDGSLPGGWFYRTQKSLLKGLPGFPSFGSSNNFLSPNSLYGLPFCFNHLEHLPFPPLYSRQ